MGSYMSPLVLTILNAAGFHSPPPVILNVVAAACPSCTSMRSSTSPPPTSWPRARWQPCRAPRPAAPPSELLWIFFYEGSRPERVVRGLRWAGLGCVVRWLWSCPAIGCWAPANHLLRCLHLSPPSLILPPETLPLTPPPARLLTPPPPSAPAPPASLFPPLAAGTSAWCASPAARKTSGGALAPPTTRWTSAPSS